MQVLDLAAVSGDPSIGGFSAGIVVGSYAYLLPTRTYSGPVGGVNTQQAAGMYTAVSCCACIENQMRTATVLGLLLASILNKLQVHTQRHRVSVPATGIMLLRPCGVACTRLHKIWSNASVVSPYELKCEVSNALSSELVRILPGVNGGVLFCGF